MRTISVGGGGGYREFGAKVLLGWLWTDEKCVSFGLLFPRVKLFKVENSEARRQIELHVTKQTAEREATTHHTPHLPSGHHHLAHDALFSQIIPQHERTSTDIN